MADVLENLIMWKEGSVLLNRSHQINTFIHSFMFSYDLVVVDYNISVEVIFLSQF